MSKQEKLFKTKIVPGKPGSGELFDEEFVGNEGPVVCLGQEFKNDASRREHFTDLLREKLKDQDFRKIEGFPIGEDEDILALSDPPYYTACPNPWIGDFIEEWENKKTKKSKDYQYQREPFAADVSEGKNDPIYNAHSYHTKVPHKAIMRYILHYTEPGDIVFDGFCGTGMTGVAAQMCGDKETIQSLGYKVEADGTILQQESTDDGKSVWIPFSKLGARRAVLNDLSPAATFISNNYNMSVDVVAFEKEAKRILKEVKKECGWMYETLHIDGKTKGKINYTVWSEVFSCPQCSSDITYYNSAFIKNKGSVEYLKEFICPNCGALCSKSSSKSSLSQKIERGFVTSTDPITGEIIKQQKRVPILLNYSIGTKRFEKSLDDKDIYLFSKINEILINRNLIPSNRMPAGDEARRNDAEGITHVHHFYIYRTLVLLSKLISSSKNQHINFLIGSMLPKLTILNRYMPQHGGRALVGPMANTLYVPPVSVENNVVDQAEFQLKKIIKALNLLSGSVISTSGAQQTGILGNSADYLFFDPPFGANIMYSELSFIRESWLKVITNNKLEAIENKTQKKTIDDYRKLMNSCFMEAYRILKPGRWMTVEFSNTKASVWNSIQSALTDAGFIISSVTALDKTRGGFHSMIGPTAVKQDLVISAYKPNGGFEERFINEAQTEEGVWDFIRTHLKNLLVIKKLGGGIANIRERDPRILWDDVAKYYMCRRTELPPITSQVFQIGLTQRFSERDGMYFLPEQVAEYDRKKMIGGGRPIQIEMFVEDEATAIEWLRNIIRDKPQSFQDLTPQFMKVIGGWKKTEKGLELSTLLEQNFLCYDGKDKVPDQIHSYLSTNWKDMRNLQKDDQVLIDKAKDRWYVPDPNKTGDLEKLREKSLLKEFEEYKVSLKKLKLFRLEAVRAGFKKCWQERDYRTIIAVAEKIPNNVLEEDPKLLMWYDQAATRRGEK